MEEAVTLPCETEDGVEPSPLELRLPLLEKEKPQGHNGIWSPAKNEYLLRQRMITNKLILIHAPCDTLAFRGFASRHFSEYTGSRGNE
jgi:hypothetical protein